VGGGGGVVGGGGGGVVVFLWWGVGGGGGGGLAGRASKTKALPRHLLSSRSGSATGNFRSSLLYYTSSNIYVKKLLDSDWL